MVNSLEVAVSTKEPFTTAEMMQDDNGNSFAKAVIDVDLDGKKHMELLAPQQVRFILKTLRLVK